MKLIQSIKNIDLRKNLIFSLIVLLGFFVLSAIVESSKESKNVGNDKIVIDKFNEIDKDISVFLNKYRRLPKNIEELIETSENIVKEDLKHPRDGKEYEYKVIGEYQYVLCADFITSNKNAESRKNGYYDEKWLHDVGYQCLKQKIKIFEEMKSDTEL